MADDHRDTGDEHGDEIAEEHLAEERRPIEREEWADAAEGEGRDRDKARARAMVPLPQRLGPMIRKAFCWLVSQVSA
jgi:hypothetical protein